jgi:hypothetical protein
MTEKPKRPLLKRKNAPRKKSKPKPPKKIPLPEPLTASQFLAALDRLGLGVASQRTSLLLGIGVRQCQRLANGEQPVPPPVERLLQMYLKFGTTERRVHVRCSGKEIEAIEIDPNASAWDVEIDDPKAGVWDVIYPWGIERFYSTPAAIAKGVRDRFKQKIESDEQWWDYPDA